MLKKIMMALCKSKFLPHILYHIFDSFLSCLKLIEIWHFKRFFDSFKHDIFMLKYKNVVGQKILLHHSRRQSLKRIIVQNLDIC
jgi:hypothetical protein